MIVTKKNISNMSLQSNGEQNETFEKYNNMLMKRTITR